MRVYHLLSAEFGLLNLEKRRLKISRLDDLNDPFELVALELSDRSIRKAYRNFVKEMAQRFGVLCFSRTWKNPVLWSHYGDKHKGMCLGFDIPDTRVLPVTYAAARMPMKIQADVRAGGLDERDMREILTTKFEDWRYEDEVRSFLRLEERDTGTGLYFKEFDDALQLREVVLGPRCTITKSQVLTILGSLASTVTLIKTRLAFKRFAVVRNLAA